MWSEWCSEVALLEVLGVQFEVLDAQLVLLAQLVFSNDQRHRENNPKCLVERHKGKLVVEY